MEIEGGLYWHGHDTENLGSELGSPDGNNESFEVHSFVSTIKGTRLVCTSRFTLTADTYGHSGGVSSMNVEIKDVLTEWESGTELNPESDFVRDVFALNHYVGKYVGSEEIDFDGDITEEGSYSWEPDGKSCRDLAHLFVPYTGKPLW